MYEKTMYKVETKDNKELYRLQDLTKNDNVETSMLKEGRNSQGKKRLECQVIIMHTEEFEKLQNEQSSMNAFIEELHDNIADLNDKIEQKNVEIKTLQSQIAEHEKQDIDYEVKLQGEKYNMLVEHQTALDELNETHKDDLLAIDKEHRKHLENMRSQYKQSYDELNDRLFNSVKANEDMQDKFKAEMLTMKEAHKDEVVSLQKEHHDKVEKLQHAHSDELQALRKQHTYDIDKLKQAIADNNEEHLIEVGKLNEKHHVEVDEIRSSFLSLLTVEHAQDLSDFNDCGDLPFYVKPFARGFVKNFNEFKKRKQSNTPKKIVETYKLESEKEKE